jgi:predicted AlkP superfamily phosphohydrolase/phosphomutase
MKVLVVGLDGADFFSVAQFWMSMPNLARLAGEGSYGELISTDFPTTPQAWCSMYTGCMPEEHGISGFRKDGIAPMRMLPWWEHVQSRNIGLVSVPLVSAGLTKVGHKGFVVPGFSAPRKWLPPTWAQARYVTETTNHQKGRARWLLGGGDRLTKNVKAAQIGFLKFNRDVESRRVDLAVKFQKRSGVGILFDVDRSHRSCFCPSLRDDGGYLQNGR